MERGGGGGGRVGAFWKWRRGSRLVLVTVSIEQINSKADFIVFYEKETEHSVRCDDFRGGSTLKQATGGGRVRVRFEPGLLGGKRARRGS